MNHKDTIIYLYDNNVPVADINEQQIQAVNETIASLDSGRIRTATFEHESWLVHEWIKKAILLYFKIRSVVEVNCPPFQYRDCLPLKQLHKDQKIRIVPGGVVRYGSHLEESTVVMPSFINIGAYISAGSMIDTWATVGSCAQIGRDVHISGGAGIGGVLEPISATPVIIEDDCFIGSRAIIVEGVRVCKGSVVGAGVTLTASTPIIDVTGPEEVVYRGIVPPQSVVISGTRSKAFPSGEYDIPCALIIGTRSESTDKKTALDPTFRR
jgi:2,3,4,5-tetrahydropyridine-2-carboxylate N-succinyltransferase